MTVEREIAIEEYSDEFQGEFERIWVNWLENDMGIKAQLEDLEEVSDPGKNYISKGGMAFYAMEGGECLGVVAVKRLNDWDFEFAKLAVKKEAQGSGLGKRLVQSCIDFCKQVGGDYLYLQSFNRLQKALKLYEKLGFENSDPPEGMLVVDRTEIIMRKKL